MRLSAAPIDVNTVCRDQVVGVQHFLVALVDTAEELPLQQVDGQHTKDEVEERAHQQHITHGRDGLCNGAHHHTHAAQLPGSADGTESPVYRGGGQAEPTGLNNVM